MVSSKKLEWAAGLFFFAFGLALFLLARDLDLRAGKSWMINIGVWPKWIGILMMFLSIGIVLQARKSSPKQVAFMPKISSWVLLLSYPVYVFLLPVLGYFLASISWMVILGRAAEERSIKSLVIFGIISTFICYLIFWKVLLVPLPAGSLETLLGLDFLIHR